MRNELVIGGYSIDTIEDLDINITKEVYNIDDPSKRQSDFSKSVDIPGSKLNDFVFKSLFDVSFSIRNTDQLNPDFNPSKKATCIYYQDTLQQISGYCQLNEIKILNNDQVTYSITIYGKNIDIFSRLTDKTLNDLTSLGTATWNDTEIVNSWTATFDPVIKLTYPMVDVGLDKYGYNGDASYVISHNYNSFKPFIYVGHIINAIFEEAGVGLEVASFFGTPQFQKLILQCDVKKFQLNQTQIDNSLVDGSVLAAVNVNPVTTANAGDLSLVYSSSQIKYSEVLDPSNQYNPTTGTFTKSGNGATNFEIQLYGELYNGSATAGEVYFSLIRKRGTSYEVIGSVRHFVTTSTSNPFSTPIYIKKDSIALLDGDEVRVCLHHKILNSTRAIDNTNVEYYPNYFTNGDELKVYVDGQIDYGVTFPIADILPNMKQTDFLMGIIKMFNLYMSPIYETGVVIEPRDIYYTDDIVDWTDLLDTSKDFTIKPQGLLENKELVFTYVENGDDLNKKFKQATSFNFGYRDLIFDNEFVKETKKVEIPFCLIPLQTDDDKNTVMRTIFDGETQEKSPKPIIAYFGGMKSGKLRYWNNNNTTATDYSTYPYAGHVDDLTSPNYDLAFDVQDFYFYLTPNSSGVTTTDNNLYNQFHKSQWEQIGNKDSKLVEAWFKLRPNDIANLDFRKTYWVKDNAYRLLTVQDYDPNGNQTTLCKLLKFAYQDAFVPTVVTSNGGNGQGEKDGGYNTNGNVIKKGILATGGTVLNDNTNGIVVTGNGNNLGGDNANILIQGDDNVILPGITDVVLINTSGLTIAESGVQYIDNIKVLVGSPINGQVWTYNATNNQIEFATNQFADLNLFFFKTASDIGGYYKMLTSPSTGGSQNVTVANCSGTTLLATFVTEPSSPGTLFIPTGVFKTHFHAKRTNGGSATIFAEVYKRNLAGTETLLATTPVTSTTITLSIDDYELEIYNPSILTLLSTDRLVIKFYTIVSSGTPDIGIYIEDAYLSRLEFLAGGVGGGGGSGTVTTVAALTLGTSGTDLSSTVANPTTTPVITLNVPTASAANRGALNSSDWSTFNSKQKAITSGTAAPVGGSDGDIYLQYL
jgi:hypothetical protein